MPTYRFTLEDGSIYRIDSQSELSDAQLEQYAFEIKAKHSGPSNIPFIEENWSAQYGLHPETPKPQDPSLWNQFKAGTTDVFTPFKSWPEDLPTTTWAKERGLMPGGMAMPTPYNPFAVAEVGNELARAFIGSPGDIALTAASLGTATAAKSVAKPIVKGISALSSLGFAGSGIEDISKGEYSTGLPKLGAALGLGLNIGSPRAAKKLPVPESQVLPSVPSPTPSPTPSAIPSSISEIPEGLKVSPPEPPKTFIESPDLLARRAISEKDYYLDLHNRAAREATAFAKESIGAVPDEKTIAQLTEQRFKFLKDRYPYQSEPYSAAELQRAILPSPIKKEISPEDVAFDALIPERYKAPPPVMKPREPLTQYMGPAKKAPIDAAAETKTKIAKSPDPKVAAMAYDEAAMTEYGKRANSGGGRFAFFRETMTKGWEAAVESVEHQLEAMGPAGQEISALLRRYSEEVHRRSTKWAGGFAKKLETLDTDEYREFWILKESGGNSKNPRVQSALDFSRKEFEPELFKLVKEIGIEDPETGKVVEALTDYTPRKYDEEFWKSPRRVAAAFKKRFPSMDDATANMIAVGKTAGLEDRLMKTKGIDRHTAEAIIEMGRLKGEKKIPSQYRRKVNLPGYRVDPLVWMEHAADWAEKTARSEVLGIKDIADPNSPISKLIEQTTNPNRAKDLLKVVLGRRNYGPNAAFYQRFDRHASAMSARAFLSLFSISNIANVAAVPVKMNMRAFLHGFTRMITDSAEARDFASRSGALYGVTKTIIEHTFKKRKVYDPLRYYMMTGSENLNRTWAAGAGDWYSGYLFDKLKKGTIKPHELKQLKDLTYTEPAKLLEQTALTMRQRESAGFFASEITQGLGEARKLPPGWNNPNPVVQLPLIFKRYMFQQTKTIKDALFGKDLPVATRARNAAYLFAMGQALGYTTGAGKAIVRGTFRGATAEATGGDFGTSFSKEWERRRDPTRRVVKKLLGSGAASKESWVTPIVDNLVQGWALGMLADILYMTAGDERDMFYELSGPYLGTVSKLGYDVLDVGLTGEMEPLLRDTTKMVPFVGPGIQREFFPTKFQR